MTRSTTFACVLTGAILACELSLASAEASVTWSFYETAITSCNALPVACVLPPQPFVLARLLLPSDTSSGSTTYTGGGPIAQHVSTGDDFSFQVGPDRVVSQTLPPDGPSDCCGGFYSVVDFNISWSETAGILDRVFIDFNSSTDNARIFMDHADLATDYYLGGCEFTQCTVAGFWQSDLPVPEPMSAALLLTGIVGLAALYRARRPRTP